MFDYTVIGRGLIGSAAGRYLSVTGKGYDQIPSILYAPAGAISR